MASFAQLERKRIGQRTKAVLDQKRREGVKLGRPRTLPASTAAQIKNLYRGGKGRSIYGIAKYLNEKGVSTATGEGEWHPATVRKVLSRA